MKLEDFGALVVIILLLFAIIGITVCVVETIKNSKNGYKYCKTRYASNVSSYEQCSADPWKYVLYVKDKK